MNEITTATKKLYLADDALFVDKVAGFRTYDISSSSNGETLYFELTSNQAFTDLTDLSVALFVNTSSGDRSAPIESIDGNCSGCDFSEPSGHFVGPYEARDTIVVGVNWADICAGVFDVHTVTAGECDANGVGARPTSGGDFIKTMTLTFKFGQKGDDAITPINTDKTTDAVTINLVVQAKAPAISCPTALKDELYFPGDSSIVLRGGNVTLTDVSGAGEVDSLIAIAKEGSLPDYTSSSTDFDLIGKVTRAGGVVSGLTNTSTGSDHVYGLDISARDKSGAMAAFGGSCQLNGVQTSEIQGFLEKSRCFIATASFQSESTPPVLLLRKFRDQFLLKYSWGEKFVDLYYTYSPDAAQWLIKNPYFRFPVLLALVPVEVVAAMIIYPKIMLGLILSSVLFGLGFLYLTRRRFRLAAMIFVGGFFLTFSSPSFAETSSQPFIDSIKNDLREKDAEEAEDNPQEKGSYTESVKKKLQDEELDEPDNSSSKDYTQKLKKELGPAPDNEGYSEKLKDDLPDDEKTSAIQDVKDGKSELQLKRPGKIRGTVFFRLGTVLTRDITADPAVSQKAYKSVYVTSDWTPDLTVGYEFQPLRSETWGSFGLFASGGFTYNKGAGQFKFILNRPVSNTPFPASSETDYRFIMVPLSVGAAIRINLAHYFRPFVKAGPTMINYFETRSDDKSGNKGFSLGGQGSVGIAFLLDWLSRRAAWEYYDDWSVKHYYLTVEYNRLMTFSGDVDFDLSGFFAGLSFDI